MAANIEDMTSDDDDILRQENIRTYLLNQEDELYLSQAAVFIEDAFKYRSIHHKIDQKSLRLYHIYFSKSFQWSIGLVIFIILSLAFVEPPSSLSWSSDPRPGFRNQRILVPCGVTEGIEITCLIFFVLDLGLKTLLFGKKHFFQSKWLWGYLFVLCLSIVDWLVSINLGCDERYRIRRLFRPFFLLQSSSLMKKTVRAIGRTVPQILSVFFLLFLHLIIFTVLGMLLLSHAEINLRSANGTANTTTEELSANLQSRSSDQNKRYFGKSFGDSLMKLLVLLTTANNPDVMMPAYKNNRLYAIYFIVFTFIGLYCFMNLLLAVIYSQFQGYLKSSLQSSYFRLRTGVRAAFEVLRERAFNSDNDMSLSSANNRTVSTRITRRLIQKVDFGRKNIDVIWDILDRNSCGHLTAKQFQELFDSISKQSRTMRPPLSRCTNHYLRVLQKMAIHRFFNYFGLVVVALNAILISVELSRHFAKSNYSAYSPLSAVNFFFVVYYLLEQCLKLWAIGWQRYITHKENLFDGCITLLLVVAQTVDISMYGSPLQSNFRERYTESDYPTWNVIKLINILIILRLVRTISSIESLSVITSTLGYLLKNLKPFGGVIVAVYYIFAIFGMMIFEDAIQPANALNKTLNSTCGSYEQLEYWANNFNDFAASLVVLWDAMIVNNWHIFLHAYTRYTSSWSQLFFVAWYLISVVICVNLFVALLLDVFIDRWQETQQQARDRRNPDIARSLTQSYMVDRQSFRVHEMFSSTLNEPSEEDVMRELVYHGFTFRSSASTRTGSTSSIHFV